MEPQILLSILCNWKAHHHMIPWLKENVILHAIDVYLHRPSKFGPSSSCSIAPLMK